MSTKPSHALTMRDRMSHLTFEGACKLLGASGKRLLLQGGAFDLEAPGDLRIDDREAVVTWDPSDASRKATARLVLDPAARGGLAASCTRCAAACAHLGGLLAQILENKSGLGLAEPPPEGELQTFPDDAALVEAALAERRAEAAAQRMTIRSTDATRPWTDYTVTNLLSGRTYRVALRGEERGISYCTCPDFKTNTLGTCKHVMKTLAFAKRRFPRAVLQKPYRRARVTVHVRHDRHAALAVALPHKLSDEARAVVAPLVGAAAIQPRDLVERLGRLEALGQAFFVTPDAEELLDRALARERLAALVAEIRKAPADHRLRTELLRVPLLPYQLDGIAFAAGAGRAILADDMGLGKTIQGVGTAELLAREARIAKVLIVCPASLKSQWRSEIGRFSRRSVEVVLGSAAERRRAYEGAAFFTVCNYEQVLKDILHIERTRWDLVILDEGQRIKNWEAKTSRVLKGLASRFALVLSGTPLENRLDDLHSVVEYVDPHALGPGFRFFHRHRQLDADKKLVGYKNLDDLRARLRPILLRRTRESVRLELPARTTKIVRIAPTAEQKDLHDAHMRTVAQIVRKRYLTEMDLLRLRTALLMCRMAADSTVLVDKRTPGYSTKLERLAELFDQIAAEPDRKVLLFSEWTTMLDLIEPLLHARRLAFVRLDGSVPQKRRAALVARFQSEPATRVFLTTNAGSTGLNLQAANTIINVDLPWNPAVLEQRIARAHRMGQARKVSVYLLVTEQTLEENLLGTLAAKRDLALAALDADSDVTAVDVRTGADELKRKLEILLGAKPEAPVERLLPTAADTAPNLAAAGRSLVHAALSFFNELGAAPREGAGGLRAVVDAKVEVDPSGKRRLSMRLPSEDEVEALANQLVGLLQGLSAARR